MQVQKIHYSCNNITNSSKNKNTSRFYNVSFEGGKQKLISISTDSFKFECAKKIYSKMQKYLKLIGNSGSIENIKVMSDKWTYTYTLIDVFKHLGEEADLLLSINKKPDKTHINLSRKLPGKQMKMTVLDALFDKNGQMINGSFAPEHLQFERNGANVRRMIRKGKQYLPVGTNDKEWDFLGQRVGSNIKEDFVYNRTILEEDNSAGGAFEVFLELARLKTSIF